MRFSRWISALALLAVLGLAVFWVVTIPRPLAASAIPAHTPDIANGERMYHASGCHSCHLAPTERTDASDLPIGGKAFKTPVGTLYPPNLTPDTETGLGNWTDADFVNAMQAGIGKSGVHLIPAFPYTSYVNMAVEDVLDIKAYLATLPPMKNAVPAHDVVALPLVRRGIGAWKYLGLTKQAQRSNQDEPASRKRGQYLVNGAGHCNECHTPRTFYMASNFARYLQGGPHPEGDGQVPSLIDLVGRGRYKDAADLASAFEFGEIMGYTKMSSGGMGAVQRNLAKLPPEDRRAIADYLLTLK
jgi:mono/diheme cytochrome c family protein